MRFNRAEQFRSPEESKTQEITEKKARRILGVGEKADPQEIKRAYRVLAKKYHPDKNPGEEKKAEAIFKRVQEAYDLLSSQAPSESLAVDEVELADEPSEEAEKTPVSGTTYGRTGKAHRSTEEDGEGKRQKVDIKV